MILLEKRDIISQNEEALQHAPSQRQEMIEYHVFPEQSHKLRVYNSEEKNINNYRMCLLEFRCFSASRFQTAK